MVEGENSRYYTRSILAFFVLATILFGISWRSNVFSPAAPAVPRELQRIRIANIGEYSVLNLIAARQGLFAQHGLDADVREYDVGPSVMNALVSGEVDVSVTADFVGVTYLFKNPDIRIFAQTSDHDVFRVIGLHAKGVRTPADLKGKTIAVTRKSAGEFYLGRFLTFNDLLLSDVHIVDMPPAEIARAVRAGTVDAALTFDPYAYDLKEDLGDTVEEWTVQAEQRTFALAYGMKDFIAAHPDVIQNYLAALIDAQKFAELHPEEAQKILAQEMQYSDTYVRATWPNFRHRVRLDQELLIVMEDEARWSIDNHLTNVTKIPNYLNAVYQDALLAIDPYAVTILK